MRKSLKKIILILGLIGYVFLFAFLVGAYLKTNKAVYCICFFCIGFLTYKCRFIQNVYVNRIRGMFLAFKLKNKPKRLLVQKNVKVFNPECITMGDNCTITEGAVFSTLKAYCGERYNPQIIIGNHVLIGAHDRIAAMDKVIIEDNVLFAAFVHITDHSHEYRKVGMPISVQGAYSKGPVVIKRGAWLAFGCQIMSGVTVGEYAVVAANSVVTKDVPPYTVVAGNPARVVKQYNFETQKWEKVER